MEIFHCLVKLVGYSSGNIPCLSDPFTAAQLTPGMNKRHTLPKGCAYRRWQISATHTDIDHTLWGCNQRDHFTNVFGGLDGEHNLLLLTYMVDSTLSAYGIKISQFLACQTGDTHYPPQYRVCVCVWCVCVCVCVCVCACVCVCVCGAWK